MCEPAPVAFLMQSFHKFKQTLHHTNHIAAVRISHDTKYRTCFMLMFRKQCACGVRWRKLSIITNSLALDIQRYDLNMIKVMVDTYHL